ncbi:hypothetical protein [Zavarzinella formosa]|uniref:hypothetical protein n=1 Tax=Zavarzinella formosa TaxID=360055 RepID=UPI001EE63F58|nr:hypothetical protein [Zavarzinella formosa]
MANNIACQYTKALARHMHTLDEHHMAKTNTSENGKPLNRSQAVRDYLKENPGADSKGIIDGLGAKGIKVTPTLIYFVKGQLNKAKRRVKREKVAEEAKLTPARNPIEIVAQVKALAAELGGIKNLKKLVDLLAE